MPQPKGVRRARNDERILASARAVFVADPSAPVAAVARHAGVGMSALYARYPSKEDLLRALCADGLAAVPRRRAVRPRAGREPVGALRGVHARRGRGRRQHPDPAPGRHLRADAGAVRRGGGGGTAERRALRRGPGRRARSAPMRASTTSRSSSSRSPRSASATRSAPGSSGGARSRSPSTACARRARSRSPGRRRPTTSSPPAGRRPRGGDPRADDERPGAAARAGEHEVAAHPDGPQPARPDARRGAARAGPEGDEVAGAPARAGARAAQRRA